MMFVAIAIIISGCLDVAITVSTIIVVSIMTML